MGSHAFSSCGGIDQEFWALGLHNADKVVLDVNGVNSGIGTSGYDFYSSGVGILAPGTDDFNWKNARPIDYSYSSGTDKERITFTASGGTGRYIIWVGCGEGDGAYDFLVESIQHLLRIDLAPRPNSLPYRGTLRASVVGGDGGPISDPSLPLTLAIVVNHSTYTFTATPTGGAATFTYALPSAARRHRATFAISTSGNGSYVGASTGRIAVAIR